MTDGVICCISSEKNYLQDAGKTFRKFLCGGLGERDVLGT